MQLPKLIEPELATLVDRAPDAGDWVHEIKFGGLPDGGQADRGKAKMLTRRRLDWTARFTPIAAAVASAFPRNRPK